jgi:cell division protein FtsZ
MSPLLEQSIDGARGVLFTITGGPDLTLFEVNEAAEIIHAAADPEANIIFGAVIDERMGGEVKISVIATAFEQARAVRRLEGPMYKRQAPSVEHRVAAAPAVAPAPITSPGPRAEETKKYAADDLEVPSFLRRR